MKTLQDIKDEYAQEQGYEDWREFQIDNCIEGGTMEEYMNEICILAQKAALENASENAECYEYEWTEIDRTSITNEQNLIR